MKKKIALMAMTAVTLSVMAQQPVDYVNPIIGTNGMGHTFPGACTLFGGVQLSPDTDTIPHNVNGTYQKDAYEYCAGYQYRDKTIVGFSHTHLSGTGHSDLGDIMLMPATGELRLNPGRAEHPGEGYRSRFSHATEKAAPGYYEVMLDDYGIKAQLTATQRVGVHKYTFPKDENGHLILDLVQGIYNYDGKVLWANLRVENDTLLTGYRITNGWARTNYTYFAISLSQPIRDYGYKDLEKPVYNGFWRRFKVEKNFPEMTGRKIVAYFNFDTAREPELVVKVALSAVSTEGALRNLRAEASGKSFEQLAEAARTDWNNELDHFEIEGTPDQKAMFYTSLYHTMINPSVYMDVDGAYRGLDHNIHQANGFTNYTIFSLWDTYRAEHPFLNLIKPERNGDMVASMIKHQQQSVHGMLPVWSLMGNENWCMSGYHAVSVLADAITKGVFSGVDEALAAMVSTSTVPYYEGVADYMKLGYVPLDKRTWFVPEVLDGMEHLSLVCIDNIECIAGDELWEMAIFDLYNRILESGKTRLLITGDRPPRQLNLGLPDLASRLDWGQIYKLQPLSDEDKLQALQLRARLRGFELPEDVGRFLLKRLDREMRTLFMTLDQLDRASITAQRKLTIPFVKEILKL